MRRNLIGVLVVLVIAGAFLAVRLGGRHEARSVLEQSLASLPPGYTATHGATDYDAITDTFTVHDFVLRHDGLKVAGAGVAVVSGAHPQALQAVFDPASYPDGKPAWTDRRPLLGHVDLTALELYPPTPGAAPLKIRHVVLESLSGRPFIRPPTAANRSAIDFQTDAAQALSVKSLAVEDLAYSEAGQGHFSIASETLSGYDGGRLDNFTVQSIDLSATASHPAASFSLAKLSLSRLDAKAALAAMQGAGAFDAKTRQEIAMRAYGALTIGSGTIEGVALKITPGPRLELASEEYTTSTETNGVRQGKGTLHGFTIAAGDSTLPPTAHALMQSFGTDQIALDMDAVTHIDDSGKHFTVDDLNMALRDLGTLHIKAKLDGYDPIAMRSPDRAARQSAMMKVIVNQATIEWDDASLTNRIINVVAQQRNSTPEQVRAAAAMPLAALSVMVPDQPDAAAQITAFLNDPHKLVVTLNPATPMSLGDVAALPVPERAHALGLKVQGS